MYSNDAFVTMSPSVTSQIICKSMIEKVNQFLDMARVAGAKVKTFSNHIKYVASLIDYFATCCRNIPVYKKQEEKGD